MMQSLRDLVHKFRNMHPWSKRAARLGTYLMLFYWIVGLACRLAAPHTSSYFYLMGLYRGCLEAAPASLAVGVCAALIGDLILRRSGHPRDGQDDD